MKEVSTAGPAYKIELTADRKIIAAGKDDLNFITLKVLDKNGNLVPEASNLVQFELTGVEALQGLITAIKPVWKV